MFNDAAFVVKECNPCATWQARDEDGNKRLCGGDDFVVEIRGGPVAVFGAVADREDGTYAVTYRVDRAGECLIHVTTGALAVSGLLSYL